MIHTDGTPTIANRVIETTPKLSDPVAEYRFQRLCRYGVTPSLAARAAERHFGNGLIELHAVLDAIENGCDPDTAVAIYS